MKSKILKELKNADDYISGQQLCERLGVSRTAVWKHIKALRAEGYEIDSVTNKGDKRRSSILPSYQMAWKRSSLL